MTAYAAAEALALPDFGTVGPPLRMAAAAAAPLALPGIGSVGVPLRELVGVGSFLPVGSSGVSLAPRCIVPLAPLDATVSASPTFAAQTVSAPLDMYLDPITLDYVDTDDGEWFEVPDSRTLVMIQLEQRLGASWESSGDGTEIKAKLEDGDPVTPEYIAAETRRALQVLVAAGNISDVSVGPIVDATGEYTRDDTGRFVLSVAWRDLASNTPVDLTYPAFER
jgi:hypothetical protein